MIIRPLAERYFYRIRPHVLVMEPERLGGPTEQGDACLREKEKEVTRDILRLLGLPCESDCSKEQMATVIQHVELRQVLRHWACAEHFARWAAALGTDPINHLAYYRMWSLYSVVPQGGYRGNALHYAALDPMLQSPARMPYAVAMLRYLGCDFDSQEDSDGHCANWLVARAMGSHSVFAPAALLLRWLHNRAEPHYRPCEQTCALLNLPYERAQEQDK